jgi:hypothetical protein
MCEKESYLEFPVRTVGGPSGDYAMIADVVSCDWVEFRVVAFSALNAGPFIATITGTEIETQEALVTDGSVTYTVDGTSDKSFYGTVLCVASKSTIVNATDWHRVVGPQRRVVMRLDGPANSSGYVSLQFRARILTRIPAPARTVHPSEQQQSHYERERRIQNAVYGKEGELEVYGDHPKPGPGVRELTPGVGVHAKDEPVIAGGWGKIRRGY